eukprot:CAMPEP_0171139922 /NCGR_PEP_ID=MMETSP0766_2-20121228/137738_1 /TAXON_ID=439317 /ORGANISM="Gambierdiscus australes, Strain CAWD 149" /LENGTH=58 /DNA_ID=CAMNT_0011603603 /DNA_START=561 /DNA_END=737 /DNA_ORIENTATION=+
MSSNQLTAPGVSPCCAHAVTTELKHCTSGAIPARHISVTKRTAAEACPAFAQLPMTAA